MCGVLFFIMIFGGVYMYSMNDVEELFGAGKVKIKFRKSIEPLSVFRGVSPDRLFINLDPNWVFPQSDIWLNVAVPTSDDYYRSIDVSVGFTGDRYCVFTFLDILVGSRGHYSYSEFGTVEEVYRRVLGIMREHGDPDVIENYVEIE
jgi:hypothetical protein